MNIRDIENKLMSGELKVRFHNGVGFMQAYLTEDVRLHVWHPELTVPFESFGNRHTHRFDLESTILIGAVVDTKLRIRPSTTLGEFKVYEVIPAHLNNTATPTLVHDYICPEMISIRKISAGETYYLNQGIFHESRAEGLTVTIMTKSNQTEEHALILAHKTQIPEHGMLRKPDQVLLNQLFFSALRKLPASANEIIEARTTA